MDKIIREIEICKAIGCGGLSSDAKFVINFFENFFENMYIGVSYKYQYIFFYKKVDGKFIVLMGQDFKKPDLRYSYQHLWLILKSHLSYGPQQIVKYMVEQHLNDKVGLPGRYISTSAIKVMQHLNDQTDLCE